MQNTPATLVYFVLVCLDASMVYIIFPPSDPATWSLLYKFLESTIDVVFLVLLLVIFFLVVWPEPLVRVASWDCGQKCLVKFDEFFSVGTMKKNDLKLKSSVFSWHDSRSWQKVRAAIQRSLTDFWDSLQFSGKRLFRAALFEVDSVLLQPMHLPRTSTKMTLYNYSI